MAKLNIEKIQEIICETVEEEILSRFGKIKESDIENKQGIIDIDDPVTLADKKTEEKLSRRLSDLVPSSLILGEEAYSRDPSILASSMQQTERPVFIIDPLDGTRNFAKGNEAFFTLVSYVEKGEIVAGITYHPLSNKYLIVEKGSGTWFGGHKLLAPSPVSLDKAYGTMGRRVWKADPEAISIFQKHFSFLDINPNSGFAALKLLISDSYFGSDKRGPQCHFRACPFWSTPWDDASMLLSYSEAGGSYTAWDGSPYSLDKVGQGILMAPDVTMIEDLKNFFTPYNLRNKVLKKPQLPKNLL